MCCRSVRLASWMGLHGCKETRVFGFTRGAEGAFVEPNARQASIRAEEFFSSIDR